MTQLDSISHPPVEQPSSSGILQRPAPPNENLGTSLPFKKFVRVNSISQNLNMRPFLLNINNVTSKPPSLLSRVDYEPLPVSPKLDLDVSTRIKNTLCLSKTNYGALRAELIKQGVNMPSGSTVTRHEKHIFGEYYQNLNKPDFYGLINTAAMKYDFSKMENVRITIGGDGGWCIY